MWYIWIWILSTSATPADKLAGLQFDITMPDRFTFRKLMGGRTPILSWAAQKDQMSGFLYHGVMKWWKARGQGAAVRNRWVSLYFWCQPWINKPQTAVSLGGYHLSIKSWLLGEYPLINHGLVFSGVDINYNTEWIYDGNISNWFDGVINQLMTNKALPAILDTQKTTKQNTTAFSGIMSLYISLTLALSIYLSVYLSIYLYIYIRYFQFRFLKWPVTTRLFVNFGHLDSPPFRICFCWVRLIWHGMTHSVQL